MIFSEDEMRVFIAGAKDAIAHYNAKPTTYVGVLFGAAGPIIAGGGVIVYHCSHYCFTHCSNLCQSSRSKGSLIQTI